MANGIVQYTMSGILIPQNEPTYWISTGEPDFIGLYSGYKFTQFLTNSIQISKKETITVAGSCSIVCDTDCGGGDSGVTGPVGPQGSPGPQGLQGSPGARGATGAQGIQGSPGSTGQRGATGAQGIQGPTGQIGPQGIQGIQGVQGSPGVTGSQGIQGLQGSPGVTGPRGNTGAQGVQGSPGPTGTIGPQGLQGSPGPTGPTGPVGAQGIQGLQGSPGVTGPQGPTGQRGATGIQGVQGSPGVTGAQGIQGNQGSPGVTGSQGIQGPTGTVGPQGIQGSPGPTGTIGPQGVQGSPGPTGTLGPTGQRGQTGAQGIQGSPGPTGQIGPQGVQGSPGVTGAQGVQGVQGSPGTTGAQGIQGPTGQIGPQGIQGLQGSPGVTGAQGATGPGLSIIVPTGFVLGQGIDGIQGNATTISGQQIGAMARFVERAIFTTAAGNNNNVPIDYRAKLLSVTCVAGDNVITGFQVDRPTVDASNNNEGFWFLLRKSNTTGRLILRDSDTNSLTNNRFLNPGNAVVSFPDIIISDSGGGIYIHYDSGANRWVPVQNYPGNIPTMATGPQGPTGPQGIQGPTGPQGVQGPNITVGTGEVLGRPIVGANAIQATAIPITRFDLGAMTRWSVFTPTTMPSGIYNNQVIPADSSWVEIVAAGDVTFTGFDKVQGNLGADLKVTRLGGGPGRIIFKFEDSGSIGNNRIWTPNSSDLILGGDNHSSSFRYTGRWVNYALNTATGIGPQGATGVQGPFGGSITIPYTFSTNTVNSDPGTGFLKLDAATQNTATTIRISNTDAFGKAVSSIIDTFDDSTNSTKGTIRLVDASNPSNWLMFSNFSAVGVLPTYRNVSVVVIGSSAASPFANGTSILISFVQAGDRGSDGATGPQGVQGVQGPVGSVLQNDLCIMGVTGSNMATGFNASGAMVRWTNQVVAPTGAFGATTVGTAAGWITVSKSGWYDVDYSIGVTGFGGLAGPGIIKAECFIGATGGNQRFGFGSGQPIPQSVGYMNGAAASIPGYISKSFTVFIASGTSIETYVSPVPPTLAGISGLAYSPTGTNFSIKASGGPAGAGLTVQNSGVPVATGVATLNFVRGLLAEGPSTANAKVDFGLYTEQTVATSGAFDVTLTDGIDRLTLTGTNPILNSISGGTTTGRILEVYFNGTGYLTVKNSVAGGSGNESRLFNADNMDQYFDPRGSFIAQANGTSGWRTIAYAGNQSAYNMQSIVGSGPHNDLVINDNTTTLLFEDGATLTGIVSNASQGGRTINIIVAGGTLPLTILHNSTLSAAGNRIVCPNSIDYVVIRGGATIVLDTVAVTDVWRCSATALSTVTYPDLHIQKDTTLGVFFRKSPAGHFWYEDWDYMSFISLAGSSASATSVFGSTTNWFALSAAHDGQLINQNGENNHLGIMRMLTAGATNDGILIYRGFQEITFQDVFSIKFLVRFNSTSNIRIELCFTDSVGISTNSFAGFTFNTGTSPNMSVTTSEGGSSTTTPNIFTPDTSFHMYEIRQTNVGTVQFLIDDTILATHSTNIPDAEVGNIQLRIITLISAVKSMDVDYVAFESQNMGNRF